MDNLFSGFFGALIVVLLQIIWEKIKYHQEKTLNTQKLTNDTYLELFILLQIPIEKFSPISDIATNWYINMEKMQMRLAILGEPEFITDYLEMLDEASTSSQIEEIRYKYVNKLRNYFGYKQLSKEKYIKLFQTNFLP